MLFSQRTPSSLRERFRRWLWPRVSWRRSVLYLLKRVTRLSGTPRSIALGSAIGVFVAFTPFLGTHFLLVGILAWAMRANVMAGLLASFVGNPVTFPFIWAGTFEIGRFLLHLMHRHVPVHLEGNLAEKSLSQLLPLLAPMTLGAMVLGFAAGCIVYAVVYKTVAAYQAARRVRLASKRVAEIAPVHATPARPGSPS